MLTLPRFSCIISEYVLMRSDKLSPKEAHLRNYQHHLGFVFKADIFVLRLNKYSPTHGHRTKQR